MKLRKVCPFLVVAALISMACKRFPQMQRKVCLGMKGELSLNGLTDVDLEVAENLSSGFLKKLSLNGINASIRLRPLTDLNHSMELSVWMD